MPSPLSFNSPRTSPFRRPESPAARSPTVARGSAPVNGPSIVKPSAAGVTSERASTPLRNGASQQGAASSGGNDDSSWMSTRKTTINTAEIPASPTRVGANHNRRDSGNLRIGSGGIQTSHTFSGRSPAVQSPIHGSPNPHTPNRGAPSDPLASLPPALLQSMRESFSALDRNNAGKVTKEDLVEALSQVGMDASNASVARYFAQIEGNTHSLNLSTYLNSLAAPLSAMTRADELNNAFAAFDLEDTGEIDLNELRDALLHTTPDPGERRLTEAEVDEVLGEFGGKKAFGKGTGGGLNRGNVFRYLEFVAAMNGGGGQGGAEALTA